MKIEWHPEAQEDLERFDPRIQQDIAEAVESLRDNPFGENTSLFNKQGLEIFRFKIKDGTLDHRVFFDINANVLILGVEHRDTAYTSKSIERVKSRL